MPGFRDPYRKRRAGWCRSCLPFLATVTLFSGLLTTLALLAHFRSPARHQRLGWQSWDVVRASGTSGAESLPLDIWDPLLPHTTGLTEIAVGSCYLPPTLFPSYCMPKSTAADDKLKGKWVMVETDLNVRTGIWYLNLYYRRTHRLDAPVITDVRIAPYPLPPERQAELRGWVIADGDLRSGVWPRQSELRLFYKTELSGHVDVVTEMDVLFGDDSAFFGFQRVQGGPVVRAEGDRWETVDIAYKRGTYAPPKKSPIFHEDGTFKILQIADLHYSVGHGACRDTSLADCDGDAETARWLSEALDAEKPDMVLNGQKTSCDSRSVLAKFALPVVERQIPWAAIFGNHDSEVNDDRARQMTIMEHMPYSLARAGPKEVDGVGNYMIKLHSGDGSRTHIYSLYFLDSGSYRGKTLPWEDHHYDYLKPSQIDWFRNASSSIQPIERPFTPDGALDLGKIWAPRRLLAKPNAMMFIHIPLVEAYNQPDRDAEGQALDVGSVFDIGSGASDINSGMLAELTQSSSPDGFPEVKIASFGHCHVTDRCRRVQGVWLCFDGGSSYSGYGLEEFERRVRVYALSDFGERVESYKRSAGGNIVDRQVLVSPM